MTNTVPMTNTQLPARIAEAVEWSNRYFDEQNWAMSEQWHLRAVELQAQLHLATGESA